MGSCFILLIVYIFSYLKLLYLVPEMTQHGWQCACRPARLCVSVSVCLCVCVRASRRAAQCPHFIMSSWSHGHGPRRTLMPGANAACTAPPQLLGRAWPWPRCDSVIVRCGTRGCLAAGRPGVRTGGQGVGAGGRTQQQEHTHEGCRRRRPGRPLPRGRASSA